MFEVGWTEMLVIAIVMIVVVGPKDLPAMLRTFGRTVAKLRSMAGDFQKQFNDALKEAELEDVKKSVDALRGLNPAAEIKKQLNPFEKAAADVRAGLDNVMKPKPAADPSPDAAATEPTPAEPLKGGSAEAPAAGAAEEKATFPAMTDTSVVAAPAQEPAEAPKAKKPTRRAQPKPAAASTAEKPAPAKAAPAKAAKTASAKTAPAKKVPAKPAAAKPAKPASGKTPAAGKKTAGAAK